MKEEKKLDNPVWYSLSETHQHFAIDYNSIKFYQPDYCPFGGASKIENISTAISEYAAFTNDFFIVGENPEFDNSVKWKNELVCLQMVANEKITIESTEDIVTLGKEHANDLFQLINLVQPGYFKTKTMQLGNYYGIFKNNQLVAVTGERMKMNKYVEVSVVVTHPDYAGKGYAKQLVAHTINKTFDQTQIPYLHVSDANVGAIIYMKN